MQEQKFIHQLEKAELLIKGNQLNQAEQLCHEVLNTDNTLSLGWFLLSTIATKRQDYQAALSHIHTAQRHSLDPRLYLSQTGTLYVNMQEYEHGARCYEKLVKLDPDSALPYFMLGKAYALQGMYEKARDIFRISLEIDPLFTDSYIEIAQTYYNEGKTSQAIKEYQNVLDKEPENIIAKWGAYLSLPILYETQEEVDLKYKQWEKRVSQLSNETKLDTQEQKLAALEAISTFTNFDLHYQNKDNTPAQKQYGQLIHQICTANFPQYSKNLEKRIRSKGEKLRIGFISSFFYLHSIFKTHGHWITKLNKNLFQIEVFHLSGKFDHAAKEIQTYADFFCSYSRLDQTVIDTIAQRQCDVIIYPDVGMSSEAQVLASLRLAPVQCVGIGHPATTGFPTMDFFLSSELMEPDDGEKYYTERLIRLPRLSSSYPIPRDFPENVVKKDRTKVQFLILQNLIKLMPDSDIIYPQIAKNVSNARFHFISGKSEYLTGLFTERLERAFLQFNLDWSDFCYMHPRLSGKEFHGLLCKGDVVLDSLNWSGFNTSMEATALNLPIVTLPSRMCRGRHTYAILKMLGLEELVASTIEEYVNIATKLAIDEEYRDKITQHINKKKRVVFNDPEPIRALEQFLLSCFERE